MVDYAKGRSTGAYFRAADGSNFLFVTGSSKAAVDSVDTVPPCIVRLRIVTSPGQPAYVAVEASENTLGFLSPGSPWVTSNGTGERDRVGAGGQRAARGVAGRSQSRPIRFSMRSIR